MYGQAHTADNINLNERESSFNKEPSRGSTKVDYIIYAWFELF